MHLVQLLLPLYDNGGRATPPSELRRVRDELTERFGGLTAHSRAPAVGLWEEPDDGERIRDDVVIYEVMADGLDVEWWRAYRQSLERRLRQEELVVRAMEIRRL
jgi:hypothetical protein